MVTLPLSGGGDGGRRFCQAVENIPLKTANSHQFQPSAFGGAPGEFQGLEVLPETLKVRNRLWGVLQGCPAPSIPNSLRASKGDRLDP